MTDPATRGLAFIDKLPRKEQTAFLGLFAGARFPWTSFNGGRPHIGKAECEWVEDWRDFYGARLKEAGLFRFDEAAPRPNHDGSTQIVEIDCGPTELGWLVREAWWERWKAKVDAND